VHNLARCGQNQKKGKMRKGGGDGDTSLILEKQKGKER
jgi:hypothetical protein